MPYSWPSSFIASIKPSVYITNNSPSCKLTAGELSTDQEERFEDGEYCDAYCFLGLVMEKREANAPAENAYRKAIRLQPDHTFAHLRLSLLLNRQGRAKEAEFVRYIVRAGQKSGSRRLHYERTGKKLMYQYSGESDRIGSSQSQ